MLKMAKAKTTLSLYWKCQLIGWSLASLYWGYIGYTGGGFILSLGILQFITDVCLYILLTHLYRNLTLKHNWQNLPLNQTIKRIIPAIFIMGACYTLVTAIKVYLLRSWFTPGFTLSFSMFFEANRLSMFIAGIRLMSIWLLAYHLYQYAQREISVTKENARMAIISRDAQLNNLAAQLNPHFLFNSLNNIKALIIDHPKSARRAIDLLSELLRNGLYQGERQLVTIKEEIEMVKDYLELEKLRFEDRLQQNIQMDNTLTDMLILRYSIQTLTENAVKHGIAQDINGGLINIKISKTGSFVQIIVENPGLLDPGGSAAGVGLKNLRERLQLQYSDRASFEIVMPVKGIVVSRLLIPVS